MKKMDYITDCILIGFSGINKGSIEYQTLIKQNPEFPGINASFNSAITFLATCLVKNGLTFDFVNAIEDERHILIEKLSQNQYRTIAISTTLCENSEQLIDLIHCIKNTTSDTQIILGGPFIVNYVRTLLGKGNRIFDFSMKKIKADFIINSIYGEDKLAAVVKSIKESTPVDKIANVIHNTNGRFILTSTELEDYDLEGSAVNWEIFKGRITDTIAVRTSVSCFYNCSFCCFPVLAGKYKSLDISFIEDDLNNIEKLKTIRLIHFIDDTFNVPIQRFKDILRMMIRNQYSFKWHSFVRCQFLDEETVQLMKESGCIGVFLGLESGNPEVLKAMNKKTSKDLYKRGIDLLNNYGIVSVASFIVGFPEETLETLEETVRFIEDAKPTFYYMGPWVYDPRTPISNSKEKYGLSGAHRNWRHDTMDFNTANKLVIEKKRK